MALQVPSIPLPPAPGASAALDAPTSVDDTVAMSADNAYPDEARQPAWPRPEIEPVRWDQYFPYQLLVLRASASDDGTTLVHTMEPGWGFTFPIPPQRLVHTTLFAIRVAATLGGITEDHNGIVFQNIVLQGSLGVLPARGTAGRQRASTPLAALAGTTLNALANLQTDLERFTPGMDLGPPNVHPPDDFDHTVDDSGQDAVLVRTSGYVQYQHMLRFLEAYAARKRERTGTDLRLALAVWKEKSVWLVTPQALEIQRDPGLDRHYSLSLKAWRRVILEAGQGRNATLSPVRQDASELARLSATLRSARRVLSDAQDVLQAIPVDVGANVDAVLEPVREAALFVGDLRGLRATAADLPQVLRAEIAPLWAAAQGGPEGAAAVAQTSNSSTRASLRSAQGAAREAQGGGATAATHPASSALGPGAGSDLLESIQVGSLPMPNATRRRVAAEQARVRGLRRVDFLDRLATIRRAGAAFAAAVGAGDPDGNAALGVVTQQIRDQPTDLDWRVIRALDASAIAMASLAATADGGADDAPTALDVMAGLARRAGAAFREPRSKFAVPFPAGASVESVAAQYLGSPDLAPELIALNGLRAPYVDEVGFVLVPRVQPSGRDVVVSQALVADRLYVGQAVRVASDTVPEAHRRIGRLRQVGSDLVVTVDGPPDMGRYRLSDHPELRAYLPDTVNSQQLIWIPSDLAPADDPAIDPSVPGVNAFDPEVAAGGVDLLLDSSHDLVIGEDGGVRFVVGRANVIQGMGVDLETERGTVPNHPEIGLPLAIGADSASTSAKAIEDAVRRMFADDPAFAGVDDIHVLRNGPETELRVSPILAGTRQLIPVRFRAPRTQPAP